MTKRPYTQAHGRATAKYIEKEKIKKIVIDARPHLLIKWGAAKKNSGLSNHGILELLLDFYASNGGKPE